MKIKTIKYAVFAAITSVLVEITAQHSATILALPQSEDIPEEILRTEIITSARSPIDGRALTAAEYAELQAQLQQAPPPKLAPKLRENIFLLNLRKALRQLFPFLDL